MFVYIALLMLPNTELDDMIEIYKKSMLSIEFITFVKF